MDNPHPREDASGWLLTSDYGLVRILSKSANADVLRLLRWNDKTEMTLPAFLLHPSKNAKIDPARILQLNEEFAVWKKQENEKAALQEKKLMEMLEIKQKHQRELTVLQQRLRCATSYLRSQREDRASHARTRSKAQVEMILDEMRVLFRKDRTLFTEQFLEQIYEAKVDVGLITREELNRQAVISAHGKFLKQRGIQSRGTRRSIENHRVTHCYNCKEGLDNAIDIECISCGWIICRCGACGCGYNHQR